MTIVKTGNTNNTNFKRVMIELANESSQISGVTLNTFKTWHKTVATWVKDHGQYMVSVNPGPDRDPANITHKYLNDCSPSSCNNQYSVVNYEKINLHSLHGGAWYKYPTTSDSNPCPMAQNAVTNFKKPVIIADDADVTASGRNNNSTVYNWANFATQASCQPLGIVHFEHLEEGNGQPASLLSCSPATEVSYIDCKSYDFFGDISPFSDLCTHAGSSCPALTATQYCAVSDPNDPRPCW